MVVIGCSSRYWPTLGIGPEWLPLSPLATPRMNTRVNPGPRLWNDTLGMNFM